jgi:ferredoxin--NADP+ reductase
MSRIVSADRLNDHYVAYEIEAPEIASRIEPGQLLEVGLGQAVVIPHAIAEFSRDKGTVTVVARHSGNDPVAAEPPLTQIDLRGPFGQHVAFSSVSKILCIAEGLGVAALFARLQELKARDIYTVVVAGFHSKDYVYWVNRLDSISNELYVVTDDGSYGIKGPMKHTIKGVCEHEIDIDRALAIGSLQLLRTSCRITNAHGIPTLISLNAVVVEDPDPSAPEGAAAVGTYDWSTASDLDGHKVDFDELVQKLGISAAK